MAKPKKRKEGKSLSVPLTDAEYQFLVDAVGAENLAVTAKNVILKYTSDFAFIQDRIQQAKVDFIRTHKKSPTTLRLTLQDEMDLERYCLRNLPSTASYTVTELGIRGLRSFLGMNMIYDAEELKIE